MRIVPVLDLLGGLVVRGAGGDRAKYRPIETPLAPSADPAAVALGLQSLGPFEAFYVADLDAIAGRPANEAALAALQAALPAVEFWVDAGLRDARDAQALLSDPRRVAVLGTETLVSVESLEALQGETRIVLSLDFRAEAFLGDPAILQRPDLWPERVIAMTLAKVGSGAGPDLSRLAAIVSRAGARAVHAAGGVRGAEDIAALEAAGIAGALVSTALHDGRLGKLGS